MQEKITKMLYIISTSVLSEIVSVDAEILTRYSRNLVAPLPQESNSAFYNA